MFDISGSIAVEESIEFSENGLCRERSEGRAEKTQSCIVNNEASLGAAPTECRTVTICPPSVGGNGIGSVQAA